MNRTIHPAPVRRSVTVNVSQARAFEVFASGINNWWPHSHHTGASELKSITLEPRDGGRWFETGVDGTESEWGKVLVWAPPGRLVLGWQLSADFKYDPDLITEVELRFIPEGERQTRVELEHRNLERFGDKAEGVRERIDAPRGWMAVLEAFAQSAT